MKNLYLEKMKTMGLAALLLLGGVNAIAQVNWKGKYSNDADNLENWAEKTNFTGKSVIVGTMDTYDVTLNPIPVHPVTTSADNVTVTGLVISPTTTTTVTDPVTNETTTTTKEGGQFTINKTDGSTFTFSLSNLYELTGKLILKSGTVKSTQELRLLQRSTELIVEGTGIWDLSNKSMQFGNGDNLDNNGGILTVRGSGQFLCTNMGRFGNSIDKSCLIQISENGKIIINGDLRNLWKDRVFVTKQITGGAGYSPYFYYDVPTSKSYMIAKEDATPFIYYSDFLPNRVEQLLANSEGSEISLLATPITAAAQSIAWKYGNSATGPFTDLAGFTTASIKPVFPSAGNIFLVCEVTKADGSKVLSNTLEYKIATDKLILSPTIKQYLRIGQLGSPLKVEVKGSAINGEWKYTTTSGSGYLSFEPVQTGTEYVPSFASVGKYFVVYAANVDGQDLISREVEVEFQDATAAALTLVWTGSVSDDFSNLLNWNPAAYPEKNRIQLNAGLTTPYPVFKGGITRMVPNAVLAAGTTLTINSALTDTLYLTDDNTGWDGTLDVISGNFVHAKSNIRLYTTASGIYARGNSKVFFNGNVIMGNANTPARGHSIYVSDNALIYFAGMPGRVSTSATAAFGKFYFSGNGQMRIKGNNVTAVQVWVNNKRVVVPDGYAFVNLYDNVTNETVLKIRDLAGFSITQTTTQYVGPDQLTSELTLSNVASLSGFEWQYSTNPFGPWLSFSTPVTGETAKVTFPSAGTYFVTCKSSDGTYTNNVLKISVVDFSVTVTSDANNVETLTVTLPTGATAVEWKSKGAADTDYQTIGFGVTGLVYTPAATDFTGGDGTYSIVFEGTVTDDAAQPVTIRSKPVPVVLAGTAVDVITTGVKAPKASKLDIYPNPCNGTFNVAASQGGTVEVMDVKGAVVLSQSVTSGVQPITISAKGVYLVKVVDGSQVKIGRVIVK